MPSPPALIDSSACRAMKQLDHLARALLLFMFPKCLALFAKLSSTVCLEPLINPAGLSVPLLSIAQSSLFYFCIFGCVCENPVLPMFVLPLFCLHLPTASSTGGSLWSKDCGSKESCFLIRPGVSLAILIGARFLYADEGRPVEHRPQGMRGRMLLSCTTLFATLAALHTHTALPDTHFLAAVCHISFYRGHMHDEITRQALRPVFIMYEWVYPLGAWRPGWGNQSTRERPSVCRRLTEGWRG